MTPSMVTVVLAGSEGRRMGGAKPLRRIGETTLIGRAVALAQTYGRVVAVAVRDADQVAGAVDARLLLDDPAIEGPLAGLASAQRFARRQGAACVLIGMTVADWPISDFDPFANANTPEDLVALPPDRGALAAAPRKEPRHGLRPLGT